MVLHMPTLNPRVNVTLSPSLDTLISSLAEFQRVSKAAVLRELLEAAEPSLRQVVALMQAAKVASAAARGNLVRDLEQGLRAAESVQDQIMQLAANHTRDIVSEAETIRGRRPARAVRSTDGRASVPASVVLARKASKVPKDPPISNRGVK